MVLYFQRAAKCLYFIQVQVLESEIHRYGVDAEMLWVEALQAVQGIQERKAVLPAGNAYGDLIIFLDHVIIIHCFSDITEYLLQSRKMRLLPNGYIFYQYGIS